MRFVLVGYDGLLCEREWPLLLVFRRLEVRLDVMVACCAEWIKDVDFRVALVVYTWTTEFDACCPPGETRGCKCVIVVTLLW